MVNHDDPYVLTTNDQGIAQVLTKRINGELKAVIFTVSSKVSINGMKVSIIINGANIEIFDEEIFDNCYYPLKIQSRDGFGQHFSFDVSTYSLNDELLITAQGLPDSTIECVLRWS